MMTKYGKYGISVDRIKGLPKLLRWQLRVAALLEALDSTRQSMDLLGTAAPISEAGLNN